MNFETIKDLFLYLIKENILVNFDYFYDWDISENMASNMGINNKDIGDQVLSEINTVVVLFADSYSVETEDNESLEKEFYFIFKWENDDVKIEYKTRIFNRDSDPEEWDNFEFKQESALTLDEFIAPYLKYYVDKGFEIKQ